MRWSSVLLVGGGIVAAGCAAVLVMALRSGGKITRQATRPPPVEQDVPVLVAAQAMPAMSVVPDSAVTVRTMPRRDAPPNCLANAAQAAGKVLTVPLTPGQVVTRNCFASEGSGVHLAAALPPGKRALSVSLSDYAGLSSLLYPGSVVDVLATFGRGAGDSGGEAISTVLLQEVQVLGVEDRTIGAPDPPATPQGKDSHLAAANNRRRLVTLLVDAAAARSLALATEHGTITLVLRNPLDTTSVSREVTSLADLSGWPHDLRASGSVQSFLRGTQGPLPWGDLAAHVPPATAPSQGRITGPGAGAAAVEAAPATQPAEAAKWATTVIRGGKSETIMFPAASP